jgi:hypothetical protein
VSIDGTELCQTLDLQGVSHRFAATPVARVPRG